MASQGTIDPAGEQSEPPEITPTGQTNGTTSQAAVTDLSLPVYSSTKLTQSLDIELENSLRWQNDVQNVANSKRIKHCLDEEHPNTPGDSLAMSLLTEKIPDVWVDKALDMPSAKQAYDWLVRKFTGGYNEEQIRRWAYNLDHGYIQEGQAYQAYVARKFRLARLLRLNNQGPSDNRIRMGIVEGLPKAFEHDKINLYNTCKGEEEDQITLILQASAKLLGLNEFTAPSHSANLVPTPRGPPTLRGPPRPRNAPGSRPQGMPDDLPDDFRGCWYCLEEGHNRNVCPKIQAKKEKRAALIASHKRQSNPMGGMALADSSDSGNLLSRWVVDSGASTHVCNDVRLMQNLHWYTKPKGLNLATGEHVAQRKACGSVCLVDELGNTCKLKDVEYVPSAVENLLSVSGAVADGLSFSNNSNGEVVSMSCSKTSFMTEVKKERGLYFVYCHCSLTDPNPNLCHAHNCEEYDLWHQRLGHPGSKNLERLQTDDMVKGISTSLSPCHSLCDVCVRGKQTRESYQRSPESATERLQLIHLDVVGELPVPGAVGERYMLTVLDDFSRLGDSMALSSKSQVGGAVKKIILYLENQTSHNVKVVRSDRGSEFVNADLLEFFNSKGIRHETSAPYSPQQNGRAERFNMSLKEKVRVLLLQAEAPQSMWADALPTAVRLLNLRAVKGRSATPYELMFGRKPSVHYLRVWGCLAYIKIPDKDLSAFSARSEAGMFVGYEPASKAYRVRVGNKVKVSKNVKFFEDKLGIITLLPESLLPSDVSRSIDLDQIPSTDEEEDWDFVPVDLSDAVDLNREAARGGEHLLPANIEVMQRLNEVLRGQMLAEESGDNGVEAPGEVAVGPGELQESGVSGAEESNGNTHPGEAPDTSDEAQEVTRRGTSRYGLRQTLAEPDRYTPGTYHIGDNPVASAAILSPPTQNGAIEQPKLSAKDVKVPEDWWCSDRERWARGSRPIIDQRSGTIR
jgi:transposase InsO family protein